MARDIRLTSIRDFTGGLNLRADPFELDDNESPGLLNVDVDPRGGVQLRQGVQPFALTIGNPNLLTANEASAETSSAGWAASTNGTLSHDTADGVVGTKSVRVTSIAAGDASIALVRFVPVSASTQYTLHARSKWKAGGTPRTTKVQIFWYTAAMGFISASTGTSVATATTSWNTISVTATSPATAAFCLIIDTITSAGAAGEAADFDAHVLSVGVNASAWIDPDAPTNVLPGTIEALGNLDTLTLDQVLLWTTTTPNTYGAVGTLWRFSLGVNQAHALGSCTRPRFAQFKDKLYCALNDSFTAAAGVVWNGTTLTALGTTFNDSIDLPNQGDMPVARLITVFQGSVWVAGTTESGAHYPNRVRWSHPNQPEDWRTDDFIDVNIGDGDYIQALVPFGDRLLVFKRHSIFAIVGTDPDNFQVLPVSNEVGACNPQAVAITDLGVYFFSWPEGVFLYDGKALKYQFSRLRPLIDDGNIPDAKVYTCLTVGWTGRRLWVAVPWRELPGEAEPTANTRVYVLDPTLSKEGSWVAYDLSVGIMWEWRPPDFRSYFFYAQQGAGRLLVADAVGAVQAYDDFGAGAVHITSYYRTNWMDAKNYAIKKRWKAPEFVLRGGEGYTLPIDVYVDYDPAVIKSKFDITVDADPGIMNWGDPWGEAWGPAPESGPRSAIVRGSPLGQASAVMLKINGPTTNTLWNLNSVTMKFIPRPPRS